MLHLNSTSSNQNAAVNLALTSLAVSLFSGAVCGCKQETPTEHTQQKDTNQPIVLKVELDKVPEAYQASYHTAITRAVSTVATHGTILDPMIQGANITIEPIRSLNDIPERLTALYGENNAKSINHTLLYTLGNAVTIHQQDSKDPTKMAHRIFITQDVLNSFSKSIAVTAHEFSHIARFQSGQALEDMAADEVQTFDLSDLVILQVANNFRQSSNPTLRTVCAELDGHAQDDRTMRNFWVNKASK